MSALSLSSSNANRSSTAAPSSNVCDEKPPSNCAGNGDASTSVSALSRSSSIDAVKGSTAAPSLKDCDDDEEDEELCRICRNSGDTENPLRFPCACRGSIKYVHQDCLLQWLNHSNARQCEVCKHAFAFSPVYAENAPTRLPFQEFIAETAKKTYHILNLFLRLSFILSIWLLILPKITFLIWKLAFATSYDEAQRLFLRHLSTENILTNCLAGFMLTTITPILGPLFVWEKFMLGIVTADLNAQIVQMLNRAENVPFAELIGWQGPLLPVIKFALHVLACNIYTLGVINFMPTFLGRVIVHYTFLKSSNPDPLIIGILAIYLLFVLYREIVEIIRYNRGEINSLFRHFVSAMRYSMKMLKIAFYPVTYLSVLPLMFGWLLDLCTIEMFGKSITQRIEFFTVSPFTSSFVHWLVGALFMLQIGRSLRLLRGVLSKNVKIIGVDPADPNYISVKDITETSMLEQASLLLIVCAVCWCLIVILVFLPVKLTMWITPSVFPLHISIYDSYTEMLFFHICVFYAIKDFDLRTKIKSLLLSWFTIVGSALGLTDYLLPRPEVNGVQENGQNEEQVVTNFRARKVMVLILAWMTLLVVNTSLIVLPVSLGRPFFTAISLLPIVNGIKFDDMYAIITGSYMIWGIIRGVMYLIEHIRNRRVNVLWMDIRKWSVIFVKSCALCVPILGVALLMYRFAWLGCLCLGLGSLYVLFIYLHNSIRDERYLIGRTLHNFEPQLANHTDASPP